MTVQAMILMTTAQKNEAQALDTEEVQLGARQINNTLANNLGLGTLVGKWIAPARLLNDPDYAVYVSVMGEWPIHIFDSEILFLPDEV